MNSRLFSRHFLTGVLLLALCGCTNIKNDRQRTQAEGAAAGAVGGALLGAAAGALAGGGKLKSIARGAAAGALAGGLIGAAAGTSVANKKGGYTKKEDRTDRQLRTTKKQVVSRRGYNTRLAASVSRKEQQLAKVQAGGNAPSRAVEEFELRSSVATKISEVDREARTWQEAIDAHKAALQRIGSDPRSAKIEASINGLTEERAELLRQRDRLISINQKLNP